MTPADDRPQAPSRVPTPVRSLLDHLRRRRWSSEWSVAPFEWAPGRVSLGRSGARRLAPESVCLLVQASPDLPLAVVATAAPAPARKPKARLPWERPEADGADADGAELVATARRLGVPFAYRVRGDEVREWDLLRDRERVVPLIPRPAHLLRRVRRSAGLGDEAWRLLATRSRRDPRHPPRHDPTTAARRALAAIGRGDERLLLVQAEGTGRGHVAFQVAWRLARAGWKSPVRAGESPARAGEHPTRILYVASTEARIERVRATAFAAFGAARRALVGGAHDDRGREGASVLFATPDDVLEAARHGELDPADLDLVVADDPWRTGGDAWTRALDALGDCVQLALAVTRPDPSDEAGAELARRFGEPLAVTTHARAVADGLLAPYVLRHVPAVVEDSDVDRVLTRPETTAAMARYLLAYLRRTDPFAKTVALCVDGAHAEALRRELCEGAEKLGLPREGYAFVAQAGAELELDRFRDVDQPAPVIALVPGALPDVPLPAVKNLALCRGVRSPAELTRLVGAASRLRPDCDKWFLTLLDFAATETTGSGIADLDELGDPDAYVVQPLGEDPEPAPFLQRAAEDEPEARQPARSTFGALLNFESAGQILRTTLGSPGELRDRWATPRARRELLERLGELGIDLAALAARVERPDADPLDLLVSTVHGTPIWSRRERVEPLRAGLADEDDARRAVLERALEQYVAHGLDELELPGVPTRRALRELGGAGPASAPFDGPRGLKAALHRVQRRMYRRDE